MLASDCRGQGAGRPDGAERDAQDEGAVVSDDAWHEGEAAVAGWGRHLIVSVVFESQIATEKDVRGTGGRG